MPAAHSEHLVWRTSSFSSDNGQCVEVAEDLDGSRWLRDTKDRTLPAHRFTAGEWDAFIKAVKVGEFD
jgi:hypothetical protein